MAPFHFQIEAAWHHSVWGLEAAKTGVFAPPALVGPVAYSAAWTNTLGNTFAETPASI